jgi:hypothetical protein
MMDFNMTKDAMKLALEALEYIDLCDNDRDFLHPHECFQLDEAITAIKQALAAPVQEPVAIVSGYYGGQCVILPTEPARLFNSGTAFYTTPPNVATPLAAQRQSARSAWVGLTQQDIDIAFDDTQEGGGFDEFARAIEQRLKEKNT